MKTRDFLTGYRSSLAFYALESLAVIVIALCNGRMPLHTVALYAAFVFVMVLVLYRGKKKKPLSTYAQMRFQSILFIINNVILSVVIDSAQVFIYAMCFSSIVCFIFLDRKFVGFNFYASLIVVILLAVAIVLFIKSQQTLLEYCFGTIVFIVINWVIVSMTSMISYQNRKNYEQERSLDDLLKVVEAKCFDAQAATRSKTRFLAHMSHEIRTPINAVMGMNEMILRESSEPAIRGYAADTKLAAESLLGIINDILDITKIEAGKLSLINAEYSMPLLISDVYNMMRFKADDKQLEFKIIADEKLPKRLIGDDVRLKQVLINLIGNAIKYTHEGSVTLEILYIAEGKIRFVVKDTGIGIKSEDIKLLFNAFERIEEDRNRNIEGTGLGLNITASLLKMFESDLNVESVYGEGSVFSFELEQEVVDAEPIGTIDLNIAEQELTLYVTQLEAPDAHVLVVDDNLMNRKVFINLLKDTKLQVSEAESGIQCLQMIQETHFDIIFMDHMMPELDGIETLAKMREMDDHLCKDTPVVVLTANALAGAQDYYNTAGFDGFLSKPIDPKKLEQTVFALLDDSVVHEHSVVAEASPSVEEIELPIIEGIDWGYARIHFGDVAALLSAVEMFNKALKLDADELQGYFLDIDEDECRSSYQTKVHSMKSSAAIIGIVQLAGMAMELENAAKTAQLDVIRSLHPLFIQRWLSYRDRLSVLFDSGEPRKQASEHENAIAEILAAIENAASEMDVDALDDLSKQLDEYCFNGEQAEKIEQIKNHILNFEIEMLTDLSC